MSRGLRLLVPFVAGSAVLVLVGVALAAGAAPRRNTVHPVVVQRAEATLEGAGGHGVPGPATFSATFPAPTRRGDLLVAAIIDGVVVSGMQQPRWHPPGWRLGDEAIGGQTATNGAGPPQTGGLQVAVWYLPDNPGGITSVDLGTVPGGTQSANTAVVAELSGMPSSLQVVAKGWSTNGPSPDTYTNSSTVGTTAPPSKLPALVLAAFTNGGTTLSGQVFEEPRSWRVVAQDPNRGGIDQPILLDMRVWHSHTAPQETMRYLESGPIDNCAVMVALAGGAPS